jgi:HK97 gp10 family phage protein
VRFEINITHNALPRLTEEMRRRVAQGVRDSARECELVAKQYAPFRYGFLRASIEAEQESELSWIVAPHTDYAIFQEFGTSRMAPRPYMRPAARATEGRFRQRMREAVGEAANG